MLLPVKDKEGKKYYSLTGPNGVCRYLAANGICRHEDDPDLHDCMVSVGMVEYKDPDPVPQTAQQAADQLAERIRMIEAARLEWLLQGIHPDAMIAVNDGAEKGAAQIAAGEETTYPKAMAMRAWSVALGIEMYHRTALTMVGQWDDSYIDFSALPKPFSVDEVFVERGGF